MVYIVVDYSVLKDYPEIIDLSSADVRLVIPGVLLGELRERDKPDGGKFFQHIWAGINGAKVVHVPQPSSFIQPPTTLPGLEVAQYLVLQAAKRARKQYPTDRLLLATANRTLAQYARVDDIKAVSPVEALDLLIAPQRKNPNLAHLVSKVDKHKRRRAAFGSFIDITVIVLTLVAALFIPQIARTLTVWGTLVVTPTAGLLLYIFRCRRRLAYGVLEVSFGCLTAFLIFRPILVDSELLRTYLLPVGGALYIIVRGLDNIEKAIEGRPIGYLWKHYLYDRPLSRLWRRPAPTPPAQAAPLADPMDL